MLEPPASLWWSTLSTPVVARAALSSDLDVDVAIVGGGYTGLWTARELLRRDSTLRVAVLEQSVCGYGASGRNGGWASALFPVSDQAVVSRYGREAFSHQRLTLQRSIADLGRSAVADGIDAEFVHGGTLTFARNDVQAERLQASVEEARGLGSGDADLTWLDEGAVRSRARVQGSLGATFSPHCARLHPAKLVRGVCEVAASLGALVFENSRVTKILPAQRRQRARVVTTGGTVRADMVVRATEGYSATLPGLRRTWAPLYSLMIATAPLPDSFWSDVGFHHYETFADDRHLIIYGQRTSDNRLAFGGRGAPYHFGSTVEARYDTSAKVFSLLEATLRELFPSMAGSITHRWGGPLAMPRDLTPSVCVDYSRGLASAGGYTGDGVVLSFVAGQALADLITAPDLDTEFTTLPFVQRSSRRWEVEPLRWLGINSGLSLANRADLHERDGRTTSWSTSLLHRLFSQLPD